MIAQYRREKGQQRIYWQAFKRQRSEDDRGYLNRIKCMNARDELRKIDCLGERFMD